MLFKAEIDVISILEEVQESHDVTKSAGLEHQDFISKLIDLHLAKVVLRNHLYVNLGARDFVDASEVDDLAFWLLEIVGFNRLVLKRV